MRATILCLLMLTVGAASPGTALTPSGSQFHVVRTAPASLGKACPTTVAVGPNFNAAVAENGTVVVWMADPTRPAPAAPPPDLAPPEHLRNVTAVAAGDRHLVALEESGRVSVWGSDTHGQTNIPARARNVVQVAAKGNHSLALTHEGTVVAWGSNVHGESDVPAGLTDVIAVAATRNASAALSMDGTITAWGAFADDASTFERTKPAGLPAALTDTTALGAGESHFIAARADGSIVRWGVLHELGRYGRLDTPPPASMTGSGTWVRSVTGTARASMVLVSNGTYYALGGGTAIRVEVPLPRIIVFAGGSREGLAVRPDGTLYSNWAPVPAGLRVRVHPDCQGGSASPTRP